MAYEDLINLTSFDLFSSVKQEDIQKIEMITFFQKFQPGDIIFMEGDPGQTLYMIKSGWIKIARISPQGREKTLALLGKGDCMGELALLDNKGRSATAQTLTRTETLCIDSQDFQKLLDEYPSISRTVIKILTERLRRANKEIENLIFHDVLYRLISFFLEKGEIKGNTLVVTRFPQREIASLIGTSRETVSRLLNELVGDELLVIEKNCFLLDKEALRKLTSDFYT